MELIRGSHNLRPKHRGCVATIGNFDGVHRGHVALLERAQRRAAELGLPTCVVTFEPHSREFLAPETAPARLTDLRGKVAALREHGVERLLVLPFNRALASLEPGEFIERILVAGLGIHHVVVGHDFAFGKGAKGGLEDLRRWGSEAGFVAEEVGELRDGDRVVGSTPIRAALAEGGLATAERLLGRSYSLYGRVARGEGIGRELGFATANLHTRHPRLPLSGVFAGTVTGEALTEYPVAVNVGRRPAVGGKEERVEAHLLDFEGDLYGRHLELTFRWRLRPEEDFPDWHGLRRQIAEDVGRIREYFGLDPGQGEPGTR